MRTLSYIVALSTLLAATSCKNNQEGVPGPRAGTLKMDNLTPEQQIEKVQNDPQIPADYKQTFINSIRAKQGQAPISGSPQGTPSPGK
jgi:hypothetical protein